MASSYMLAERVYGYEVKVSETKRGRKVVVRKSFTDYVEAMDFLDTQEELFGEGYIIEFDTKFR